MSEFFDDDSFEFDTEAGGSEEASMNLTPMVDVIFILLVFFLCVSQFKSGTLSLNIPKTDKNPEALADKTKDKPIVVEIAKNDVYALAGERITTLALFRQKIQAMAKTKGTKNIVLVRGDTKVEYGKIMRIIAMLQQAGWKQVECDIDSTG